MDTQSPGRSSARGLRAAVEWASLGVRVNATAPGYVETEMNVEIRRNPDIAARILGRIPARRMATPAKIAQQGFELASPRADHMVGAIVLVDGGESIR